VQRCTSCGTELRDSARFCTHCGQSLSPQSTSNDTIDKQSLPGAQPQEDLAKLSTHPLAAPTEQEQEISRAPTTSLVAEEPHAQVSRSQETSSSENPSLEDEAVLPVTPPQQVANSAEAKRKRRTAPLRLVIGIIAVVIIAGGAGALLFLLHPFSSRNTGSSVIITNPTSDTAPTAAITACPGSSSTNCLNTPSTLSNSKVDLTFSGAVAGHMTVTSVIACGAEPSVAGGQQYHVSILGTVNGEKYGFSFDAYPYTRAGIYTGNVNSFFGPAGDSSSLTQWRSASTQSNSVTVRSDSKSGTLNISLVSSSDHSTVGVVGNWMCA